MIKGINQEEKRNEIEVKKLKKKKKIETKVDIIKMRKIKEKIRAI